MRTNKAIMNYTFSLKFILVFIIAITLYSSILNSFINYKKHFIKLKDEDTQKMLEIIFLDNFKKELDASDKVYIYEDMIILKSTNNDMYKFVSYFIKNNSIYREALNTSVNIKDEKVEKYFNIDANKGYNIVLRNVEFFSTEYINKSINLFYKIQDREKIQKRYHINSELYIRGEDI